MNFFHDLAQGLVNHGAELDAVFAMNCANEYFYEADQSPLSWTSGKVTTADGETYDMSDLAAQQQMMDNGLVYFTDQIRAAILAVDPTALAPARVPPNGCGIAYQLTPPTSGVTWSETTLHAFAASPTEGWVPSGGLFRRTMASFSVLPAVAR